MKTLILAAIRCSLMFTAVTASLFSVRPAQAYTVTLEQVGSNVVATGTGAFDLIGLMLVNSMGSQLPDIFPSIADTITGASLNANQYRGPITGPSSFGSGGLTVASNGNGDFVAMLFNAGNVPALFVPQGYVSGTALSDIATYNSATFGSLGVTPGTYVWTWGTGANQNFTLQIGSVGVPDGGSTVSLLGCALLGLAALRRRLGC